jgi:hypothetical protein
MQKKKYQVHFTGNCNAPCKHNILLTNVHMYLEEISRKKLYRVHVQTIVQK